jgi:hypothetical protein
MEVRAQYGESAGIAGGDVIEISTARKKKFDLGKVLLGLAVVPWLMWIFWLGRNDPFESPVLHHQWSMRITSAFAVGTLLSFAALILLLFGKGWKRVVCAAAAIGLFLFYAATMLVGD